MAGLVSAPQEPRFLHFIDCQIVMGNVYRRPNRYFIATTFVPVAPQPSLRVESDGIDGLSTAPYCSYTRCHPSNSTWHVTGNLSACPVFARFNVGLYLYGLAPRHRHSTQDAGGSA